MKNSYEIKEEIKIKTKLLEKIEFIENAIKSASKSYSKEILEDANLIDNYLVFRIPTANNDWTSDILRIVLKITETKTCYVKSSPNFKGDEIRIIGLFD